VREDVVPEPALLALHARRRALLLQPPAAQLAERHAGVAGERLEAVALALGPALEISREP
jgi:hypothetical protein